MNKRVATMCICLTLPWVAAAAAESAYEQAEAQYQGIVLAHLQGSACNPRSAEVQDRQRALAATVARLSATDGPKVLQFAVIANNAADVRRLLAAGAERTGDNGSLLHAAAGFGDAPLLEILVQAGLGIEDHGGAGGSALFAAVQWNRADNAQWLIRRGADVNAVDNAGVPLLRHALICRNQALVTTLVRAGARPDARTRELAEARGMKLR
jgi:ankyrin repeat protein